MINACFERRPRYLLVDEIEHLKQSDQAALLSLMQSGVLVETKISKTRRIEFRCSVLAICNDTKRLKAPLLSRFAVINIPEYDKEQFVSVTKDVLKQHPLAQYIAEQVWLSVRKRHFDYIWIKGVERGKSESNWISHSPHNVYSQYILLDHHLRRVPKMWLPGSWNT